MSWVETESLSFLARHETDDDSSAQRTLDVLEDLRLRLEDRFEEVPDGVTVIVHPTPAWLAAAHPYLPAARLVAAPAARRYLAGWALASELHVLNDHHLELRAAGEDSLAALRGTAERLYVQIVIAANNKRLPPPWGPRRFARYLRWTWLVEGAAQYFSRQTPLFRAAINTRMRAGSPPTFPPSPRDAIILGGTVFDLLERERGADACKLLVSRLRPGGARAAVELAFDARFRDVQATWSRYLRDELPRKAREHGPLDESFDEDLFVEAPEAEPLGRPADEPDHGPPPEPGDDPLLAEPGDEPLY